MVQLAQSSGLGSCFLCIMIIMNNVLAILTGYLLPSDSQHTSPHHGLKVRTGYYESVSESGCDD